MVLSFHDAGVKRGAGFSIWVYVHTFVFAYVDQRNVGTSIAKVLRKSPPGFLTEKESCMIKGPHL